METHKELINQRIDYLNNIKNTITTIETPKINRPAGKKAFIEFQEDVIQDLERVIDSEIEHQLLLLKYYSLRERMNLIQKEEIWV